MLDGLDRRNNADSVHQLFQFVGFLCACNQPGHLPPLLAATLGALITTWIGSEFTSSFRLAEMLTGLRLWFAQSRLLGCSAGNGTSSLSFSAADCLGSFTRLVGSVENRNARRPTCSRLTAKPYPTGFKRAHSALQASRGISCYFAAKFLGLLFVCKCFAREMQPFFLHTLELICGPLLES